MKDNSLRVFSKNRFQIVFHVRSSCSREAFTTTLWPTFLAIFQPCTRFIIQSPVITVVLVLVGSTLVGSRKPFCCRASKEFSVGTDCCEACRVQLVSLFTCAFLWFFFFWLARQNEIHSGCSMHARRSLYSAGCLFP